jgi:UDP-N-acetylglucosamine--dolichyl-phosphate N-acetylglucosaminephosphotransferase
LKEKNLFPKAIDHHKPNKPFIPNGLGVIYVLVSAVYLFLLYYFDYKAALPLAGCILFGGFMGLLDDWMDLRWRYKAFLPIFASLPLVVLREGNPIMATYIFGKVDFSQFHFNGFPLGETLFYFAIIPLIVTIATNAINQLGGLNGLETICPSTVLIGLMLTSNQSVLLFIPLAVYLVLAVFNFFGKIFVGNTGSFAIGITVASYAILANNEQTLLISILPFIFNSSLILLNVFLFGKTASLIMDGNKLRADNKRSLLTLIAHHKPLTELKLVSIVSLLVAFSTFIAIFVWAIQ